MKLISLFSGCGGMDIGFEGDFICLRKSINTNIHPDWIKESYGEWVRVVPTIFDTVFANDIRPDAKAAWVSYFREKKSNANEIYHLDSIVDLVKRAKSGENVFPEEVDIVTGGFPCQDFSIAGKRMGLNSKKSHLGVALADDEPSVENRGQLYMWMREVITLTSPKLFIAENVKGLTNLKDVKEIIECDFAEAGDGGYLVVPAKVLYAPDYGVPQSRERVIFYGFKKSALTKDAQKALSQTNIPKEYDPYPVKTHGGRVDMKSNGGILVKMPAAFGRIQKYKELIEEIILESNEGVLAEYWRSSVEEDRITQWCRMVANEADSSVGFMVAWDVLANIFCLQ